MPLRLMSAHVLHGPQLVLHRYDAKPGCTATTVKQVGAAADAGPAGAGPSAVRRCLTAQVRAALTAEDAAAFDRQWRAVMARATERLELTEVHEALEEWRRVAWVTSAHGPEIYRQALASAKERLQTGERASGAVPWAQLKGELGLPSEAGTGRARPVSYAIDIDPGAQDAIATLPVDGLLALAEAFAVLEVAP